MDFALTEEQEMIRDSAQSFLADVSGSEAVRVAMATEAGFDAALWQRICGEMYWQAIHIPEQYGGMGLGYVELATLLEQMGRQLLCSPFFSTVCLAANALLVAGSEEQKQQWLPQIVEGTTTATLAYTGRAAGWDADAVTATYCVDGGDFVLSGDLHYVPDGHTAGLLVVAAREQGSAGESGISLFLLPAETAGVTRQWLATMDQTRKQARIVLDDVRLDAASVMGEQGRAWPQLHKVIQLAQVAVAAEQMGGAEKVLQMAVDYSQEREQFGRSIASYQAIKHRAADMMLKAEVSRSAVYYAACVAEEALSADGDAAIAVELSEVASMAKAYCSDSYFFNAGCALQLFGGVGFTWEYDCQLYFKRAKSSETFLGNGGYHRELIAAQLLDSVDTAQEAQS